MFEIVMGARRLMSLSVVILNEGCLFVSCMQRQPCVQLRRMLSLVRLRRQL